MLKSGAQHLEQLRDGRVVYVGSQRIDDVTTHPAFRHAARSIADIYDMKADPAHRAELAFTADGEPCSAYFLQPRTPEDLLKRSGAHRRIADLSYGMLGRSPDHVASFVTGMSMNPGVFGRFADNITAYHREMRSQDLFAAYAVVPPQAARNPAFYQQQNRPTPTLKVVEEDADGVVISGMKMLATGAVFANEIWIGNLIPLAPDQAAESITCAVPVNAPGLALWSRKPLEPGASSAADAPLTWRFDETDSMVICDRVRVPWRRVFVHNDALLARAIYLDTPAHACGNHQSNVRFWSKLRLLVGVASRVARATGADQVPAVRETLGRLASLEALLAGLIHGQIQMAEAWPEGFLTVNRRTMYATMGWCADNHSALVDSLRELCGGSVFQLPADRTVLDDPALRDQLETFWAAPQIGAVERMQLFRLAWDLVGSEFAGRHQQYEKFYAGPSFVVRNYSYALAPWDELHGIVDGLIGEPER